MLKFVSAYLALSYVAFATLVVAGLLQALAARYAIVGFALLDYRPSARRRLVGPLLILTGYAWFFGTRRELLTPGPAGAELVILFGAGVLLALGLTLLGATLLHPYRRAGLAQPQRPAQLRVERASVDSPGEAVLFVPAPADRAAPAICLVPDLRSREGELEGLAGELARQGLVVLLLAWETGRQEYPEALSMVPVAMAVLSRQPFVDAHRLGVVGVNLGGDLALRAAAEDRQIRAVAALAPEMDERNVLLGLGLLHEMTYGEALGWGARGRRRRLIRDLGALQAVERLGPRTALILYGSEDALVPLVTTRARLESSGPAVEVDIVPGESHLSLAASPQVAARLAQWLTTRLGPASPSEEPSAGGVQA